MNTKASDRLHHLLQLQMELGLRGIGSTMHSDGIMIKGANTANLLKSMLPLIVAETDVVAL